MSRRANAAEQPQETQQTQENGNGTAVAIATPEAREAANELELIRQQGMAAVERKRALSTLTKLISGLEWGSVRGDSLSPATQYALAEVCYVTGANPYLHIDLLGGKAYHNAQYYEDLANQHSHYLGYEQRMITARVAERLREQADQAESESDKILADIEKLGMPELKEDAVKLRREAITARTRAREIDLARAQYGVPDTAETAYETLVRRYTPDAPLDAIRVGDIDGDRFIQVISECSWIDPGRKDPVGNAHPDRTCRTRSLRRGLKKAFSAWIEPKMREVERYERQIEAEWREVREGHIEARAALPRSGEAQAVRTGNGEPSAARVIDAEPLPVEDATADEIAPIRQQVIDGCNDRDLSLVGLADDVLGHEPETLADWQKLLRVVRSHVAQMDEAWRKQDRHLNAEGDEQGRLV